MKLDKRIPPELDALFDPDKKKKPMDDQWFRKLEEENTVSFDATDKWVSELELRCQETFVKKMEARKGKRRSGGTAPVTGQ